MSNAGTLTIAPSVGDFLVAIRQHESGGDYTAYNSTYGASGAYQFIPSTWQGVMNEIDPTGTLAKQYPTASSAPPQIQDNAAALYASQLYYGPAGQNWGNVAMAWYGGPGAIGHPEWGDPNNPQAPTVGQYATTILASMPSGTTASFTATPNQATTTSFWSDIWGALGQGLKGGPITTPGFSLPGAGVFKDVVGAAKTSGEAISAIFNSATWTNFGSIIGGGILMYVGFRLIEADLRNSKESVGQVATQAAEQPVQAVVQQASSSAKETTMKRAPAKKAASRPAPAKKTSPAKKAPAPRKTSTTRSKKTEVRKAVRKTAEKAAVAA